MSFKLETSWDDGHILDLKIAEILQKHGLSGIFYVVIDRVGKKDNLSWEDIKSLIKAGFEIGSHTVTHPQDLKLLFEEDLFFEVQTSKEMLETVLGNTITSFCYPRGRADARVKSVVKDAGYLTARGTGRTGNISDRDKFYLPGTIHIYPRKDYGGQSIVDFAKKITNRANRVNGYVNIFGHSWEIEKYNLWDDLVEVLKYAKYSLTD